MSRYGKEINIGILVTIITGLAIYYFSTQIHTRQVSATADWYRYVPAEPHTLLNINRPSVLSGILFPDKKIKNIFVRHLPEPSILLISNRQTALPLLVSFHTNGEVFYAKATKQQFKKLQQKILDSFFSFYTPEIESIGGIQVEFYPAPGNRFFGFFYHQGIWVGSYSRKLLEESIQHITSTSSIQEELPTGFDPNSPINIFLLSDSVKQYTPEKSMPGQAGWKKWMVADIFINEQSVCFFTQTPDMQVSDPEKAGYLQAMDTYLSQITRYTIQGELSTNLDTDYYSACIPLFFR